MTEGTIRMPPTTLAPSRSTRFKVAVFSALVSPVALSMLLYSVSLVVDYSAVGQPLSSSVGVAAIIVGMFLLGAVGSTATQTSIGLGVTTIWAALFTTATLIAPQNSSEYAQVVNHLARFPNQRAAMTTILASVSWCGFSVLALAIAGSAFFAARCARRIRLQELDPNRSAPRWMKSLYGENKPLKAHSLYGDAQWFTNPGTSLSRERSRHHSAVLVIDIFLALSLWTFVIAIAPKDISRMAAYGPLALGLNDPHPLGILVIAGVLFLLTLTAGWSMLGPLISTTLVMIFPGTITIPVWATLTGNVAMPGNPATTSLALACPVVGTLGILILALTWGIHWIRVAPPEADSTE